MQKFKVFLKNTFHIILISLLDFEVLYYLAYGSLAILGLVIHPFFMAFHMTEVFIRYPTLKYVLKSVYEPRI